MRSQLARSARCACLRLFAAPHAPLPPLSLSYKCSRPRAAGPPCHIARHPSRRTFFGFLKKAPRQLKAVQIEPGYDEILRFRTTEIDNARPPPPAELVPAFRTFFRYKLRHRKPVNETQAFCALRLFLHLRDHPHSPLANERWLGEVQEALLRIPSGDTKHHLALSREIYQALRLQLQRQANQEQGLGRHSGKTRAPLTPAILPRALNQAVDDAPAAHHEDFHRYVTALAQYGAVDEAIAELSKLQKRGSGDIFKIWMVVLRAVTADGKGSEKQVLETVAAIEQRGIPYGPLFHEIMTGYYAARGNAESLWKWFEKGQYHPTPKTYLELLKFSLKVPAQRGRVDDVFQGLCASSPPRELWDIIVQWAVCSRRQGLDDIKKLVQTLAKGDETYPNVTTINSLLRAATDMKEPLLAERFIQWWSEFGIRPDATTYALQMEYRLSARDLSGAEEAFEGLMGELGEAPDAVPVFPTAAEDDEAAHELICSVTNKYLRALCSPQQWGIADGNKRLLSSLELVEERQVMLEPTTAAALCLSFLENDQEYELMDTLSLHTLHYSNRDRAAVIEALVSYCLNPSYSTARIWNAYSLLRQFFGETTQETRVRLMDAFLLKRRRSDMAAMIFGHMRAHSDPSIRPDLDLYVRFFATLARMPGVTSGRDMTTLRFVHNMLKMDTTITPDTRLYNALMMAYTACGDPDMGLEFWRDITSSRAGPSYNSLAVFFWANERMELEDPRGKEVWAKMMRLEVEVPPFVAAAYCGCLAATGDVDAVKSLLQGFAGTLGYGPDSRMLRISYNALQGDERKDAFEAWAKEEYPGHWSELEAKVPRARNWTGNKVFKHPRDELQP